MIIQRVSPSGVFYLLIKCWVFYKIIGYSCYRESYQGTPHHTPGTLLVSVPEGTTQRQMNH